MKQCQHKLIKTITLADGVYNICKDCLKIISETKRYKTIPELQIICHNIAVKKGFWDCPECNGTGKKKSLFLQFINSEYNYDECNNCNGNGHINRNNGELIALMHAELSEALEDLRKGNDKHVGEELADCVIRILDFCQGRDIDLAHEIENKIKKNKKRPYKHNKKF